MITFPFTRSITHVSPVFTRRAVFTTFRPANSSALALNLGLFRGFRLDNYPWFPILILSPACQRRRTGDYQYSSTSTTGTHSQRLLPKHPVAAARALGHDQERRSDEHTRVRLDMTRSGGATSTRQRYLFGYRRRPDVAHLSAGYTEYQGATGIFRLV